MLVLGIETTCDETSVSLVRFLFEREVKFEIISNVVLSQNIHSIFGGVLPEQAFRKHQENLIKVLKLALREDIRKVNLVGVSSYPGLLGALAVGVACAKTIAACLNVPVIPVNHLLAHILVNFYKIPLVNKKYLGVVLSGGHTNAYLIESLVPLKFSLIAKKLDDAIGEAFDKVARMMNLGFPGGPIIDKLAQEYKQNKKNEKLLFPIPDPEGYNFSYSGLKTAVYRYIKNNPNYDPKEIAFNFQYSAIKQIINKIERMINDFSVDEVLIGGGVASNSFLREEIGSLKEKYGIKVHIPEPKLCTDNAAMVAIAASILDFKSINWQDFDIYPSET